MGAAFGFHQLLELRQSAVSALFHGETVLEKQQCVCDSSLAFK